jgi:hypothetical protein
MIFWPQVSYPPNPSLHQNPRILHQLEQLIGREARGKLKEVVEHALGTGEPPGEDPAAVEDRPSSTNTIGPL